MTMPAPYLPQPVDTSAVVLPAEVEELTELLARNAHETWAQARMAQGWTYGPARDDAALKHPDLVPYEELEDAEKEYDRRTAMETLRVILSLGFDIVKR